MKNIILENFGSFKLINFIELELEEKKMILQWRNHEEVKKWMYNKEEISLESHLKYIDSLNKIKCKQYFLVQKEKDYIGVIDFTNINYDKKECEFGLYSNPFNKIVGVGRILEELSIKYVFEILKFKKLKLEVFSDNKQVINLHKKYKFHETSRKKVNNKEVICMELSL